jgi:hypothetical protein
MSGKKRRIAGILDEQQNIERNAAARSQQNAPEEEAKQAEKKASGGFWEGLGRGAVNYLSAIGSAVIGVDLPVLPNGRQAAASWDAASGRQTPDAAPQDRQQPDFQQETASANPAIQRQAASAPAAEPPVEQTSNINAEANRRYQQIAADLRSGRLSLAVNTNQNEIENILSNYNISGSGPVLEEAAQYLEEARPKLESGEMSGHEVSAWLAGKIGEIPVALINSGAEKSGNDLFADISTQARALVNSGVSLPDNIPLRDMQYIQNFQNVNATTGRRSYTKELLKLFAFGEGFEYEAPIEVTIDGRTYRKGDKIPIHQGNANAVQNAIRQADPGKFDKYPNRSLNNIELPAFEAPEEPEEEAPEEEAAAPEEPAPPARPETPRPNFAEVAAYLPAHYSGIDVRKRHGDMGMGTSEAGINNMLIDRRRADLREREAEEAAEADFQRRLATANGQLERKLQEQAFLNKTANMDAPERESALNELIQSWMVNPAWSPDGTDDPIEKNMRRQALFNDYSNLIVSTQQSAMAFADNKAKTEAANNIEATLAMVADGSSQNDDNDTWSAISNQFNSVKGRYAPSEFNSLVQETTARFIDARANKLAMRAIASAGPEGVVQVNPVLEQISREMEEAYFDEAVKLLDGKVDGHIFEDAVNTTVGEIRKILTARNEELFKQHEGQYQVFNNNGQFAAAAERGVEWRNELDAARQSGNVDEGFYFSSKDYFKPMAVAASTSGADVVKSGGANDSLIKQGIDDILTNFNTSGTAGANAAQVINRLKAEWEVGPEYVERYLEPDEKGEHTKRGRALETLIRDTLITNLINKFQSPDGYKAMFGANNKIQEMFANADNVARYLSGLDKKESLKADLTSAGGETDGVVDKAEREAMAEYANNIIWGAFIDDMMTGFTNLGNPNTRDRYMSETMRRAFSLYLIHGVNAGSLADQVDKNGAVLKKIKGGGLANWVGAVPNMPVDPAEYYKTSETAGAGSATLQERRDADAARQTLTQLMTNYSRKTDGTREFSTDEFGYDEEGRPMLMIEETGDRFVFVKNGGKIDVLVFDSRGRQGQTIKDIEKQGLRK